MDSVLAEQQQHHKYHHSHQLYHGKKSLREIDIPPRKLLSRRAAAAAAAAAAADHMFLDSPKLAHDEALLYKFLSGNTVDDDDGDADPYSSDHFRMYEFKVRKCTRSRSHDWTDCPFAHPGEKARRRDPRRFHYSGTVCSEFRRGSCSRGDNCEFAHGVFECWLHPSRYRTEACKDGKNCKRKICFFAHTARQLRVLPVESSPPADKKKCCIYCHHSVTASPTSTLMGINHLSPPLSPSLSPPLSPVKATGFSRYGGPSYKDALTDLIEAMHVSEMSPVAAAARAGRNNNVLNLNLPWLDVNFNAEEQQQFMMSPSPSTSSPSPVANKFLQRRLLFDQDNKYGNVVDQSGPGGPDFGWVNDLLT